MKKLLIDYRNFFALSAFLIAVDHFFYDMPAVIIVLCLCYFELTKIRGVIQSKLSGSDIKRFDKSFFEKGEDVVMPGTPPDDTILFHFPGTVTADEAMELLKRLYKKSKTPPPTPTQFKEPSGEIRY